MKRPGTADSTVWLAFRSAPKRMVHGHPVSIAALLASGAAPRPHEAVAIVLELCAEVAKRPPAAGVMPAISTSTVVLGGEGTVSVTGGVPGEDEQTVFLVGRLLLEMLDEVEAVPEAAVQPRLRATAARAAAGGRSAFPTIADLVSALRRHGPDYAPREAIAGVLERWYTGNRPAPSIEAPQATTTATSADGRKNAPTPDVLRRFLREAEQEAYHARLQLVAHNVPAVAATPVAVPESRPFWVRATRALLVGVILLALAGAGMLFLGTRSVDTPPLIVPISKPTPPVQRTEPGWELLRQPERVSLDPPSTSKAPKAKRAGARGDRREAAPAIPEPIPGR